MSPEPSSSYWHLGSRWASHSPIAGLSPGEKASASEIVLSYCDAPYEIPTLREALISEVFVVYYQKEKTNKQR